MLFQNIRICFLRFHWHRSNDSSQNCCGVASRPNRQVRWVLLKVTDACSRFRVFCALEEVIISCKKMINMEFRNGPSNVEISMNVGFRVVFWSVLTVCEVLLKFARWIFHDRDFEFSAWNNKRLFHEQNSKSRNLEHASEALNQSYQCCLLGLDARAQQFWEESIERCPWKVRTWIPLFWNIKLVSQLKSVGRSG